MKKLFLLIPAFLLSIAINATILDIAPNSPQASDNVRREIRDHINSGDTLRLADGTYSEAEVIELNKSVTIIAAEGAHPIIAQHYYSKVFGGADVKFIGIKNMQRTSHVIVDIVGNIYQLLTKLKLETVETDDFINYTVCSVS